MNGKSTNGGSAGGGMLACIEGLPPLPKSLSGLLNSSGGSWRDMERMYVKKTMIQDDLSRGRSHQDSLMASKPPANLDAALALLRKEMVGLRQQDMSLLCQLWSLHESIQEYKGSCHDLSAASSAEMENGYFDEDDEYYQETGGPTTPGGEQPDEDEDGGTTPSAKNGGGGSNGGGIGAGGSSNDSSSSSWLQDSFHVTI